MSMMTRLRHAAKMLEGVLERSEEVFGGLPIRGFAVSLARMGQHDAKDMRLASLAVPANDRRSLAEIDLRFLARGAFQAAEW